MFASTVFAIGQVQVADVGNLQFEELPSPDMNVTRIKKFRPKDWLEVEASMEIPPQNRVHEEVGFLDRVMVRWYVAMIEEASGKPMLLTTDVNHVNVEVDEEVYTSIYISPNTLKRLTGRDRAAKTAIEAIGLEIFVDGVKVGQASEGKKAGWWESAALARGDRFPLQNKNQTPFKMLWWDRYAEIEEQR